MNECPIYKRWAMPSHNTFSIKPIRAFIDEWRVKEGLWIDPFSNGSRIADVCNDLDPEHNAEYCMDALEFLKTFKDGEVTGGVLFDPPYSPRQVSECYKKMGLTVNMATTQSSFWSNMKKEIGRICSSGAVCLSFGWNSGGIGKSNGFEQVQILLVAHGGYHNDTICVAEIKQ